MANIVQGIFTRPMFSGDKSAQQKQAAQGFSQVFATILARQMRQSTVGADQGPLGLEGGASGNIYGAFMDDAMGKLLAASPAMKALNQSLARELAGPRRTALPLTDSGRSHLIQGIDRTLFTAAIRDETAVPSADSVTRQVSQSEALLETSDDGRGPRLLPPPPHSMAPELPQPLLLSRGNS